MNPQKVKALFVILITFTLAQVTNANTEFFVTVNPDSGTFSIVKPIPGVTWVVTGPSCTTIDKVNNRFFFRGDDSAGLYRLYTLDANSGNVIYATYSAQLNDNINPLGQFQYDDSAMALYGLYWQSSTQTEYFVGVNEVTGAVTIINSIPGVRFITTGLYTYDQNHHTYFFIGSDSSGANRLYSIQASTGNVLYSPVVTGNGPNMIRYDNSTNTLFGHSNGNVIIIDPATSATTPVANITEITSSGSFPSYTTFDEIHHRYILGGTDSAAVFRLYTIDVLTGNVISKPPFPIGLNPGENVIELNFNNSNGILYALHWGNNPETAISEVKPAGYAITYFPNPFINSTTFYLPKKYHRAVLNIYNSAGQVVRKEEKSDVNEILTERGSLAAGPYLFEIMADSQIIARGTVVIQ